MGESIFGVPSVTLPYDERSMAYNVSSYLDANTTSNDSSYSVTEHLWGSVLDNTSFSFNGPYNKVRPRKPVSFLQLFLADLDAVIMPIALSIGIVGSLLIVLIFMLTPLCSSALSHYLTALGISDFIYLLACLAVWIDRRVINFQNTMGVCQVTMFSLLLSRFLVTWYLFTAHAERVLVHFGSPRHRKWCTTFRTKCIIITIFVFSLVGFIHYMWTHIVMEKNGESVCILMPESVKHVTELRKIEIITSLFLPMLLILIIDMTLCLTVAAKWIKRLYNIGKSKNATASEWRGEYMLAQEGISRSPSTRSGDSTPPPPEFDISREKTRATLVVVIAGLIFICLILPSSVFRAKNAFSTVVRISKNEILTMNLSEEIVKFNSVYKIFLYLIVLKSFRHGLVQFFKHGITKEKEEDSQQETSV